LSGTSQPLFQIFLGLGLGSIEFYIVGPTEFSVVGVGTPPSDTGTAIDMRFSAVRDAYPEQISLCFNYSYLAQV